MSLERTAADLEAGLGTFAEEFDWVVSVVDQRYEQVARFVHERAHLAEFRSADPVKLLLEDSGVYAGEQELLLTESSEIEEIDVDLEAVCASPCEDVFLEQVKARLFYIDDYIDGGYLPERTETGGYVAQEFLDLPFAEDVKDSV